MGRDDQIARRGVALLLAASLLAGCAFPTEQGYVARMSGLIGASEAELVAALGVPVRSYEAGGLLFLQYEEQRLVSYPGTAYVGRAPWWGMTSPGPYLETRSCSATFALRHGRVESFSFRGNDCRAVPPRS